MNRAQLVNTSYEAPAAQRRSDAVPPAAEDELRPARGVLFSTLLGCGLWLAILYCAWLIVR